MEELKNLFTVILDDDERIEKVYKPQKFKMFFSGMFGSALCLLFFVGIMCLVLFVPGIEEDGTVIEPAEPIACLIPIGIFIVVELLVYLFVNMCYKKTVYAVTNKRIIIRTGVIGVDFKSLDMGMIGAIDVYVSLIDRMLGKNTGSIRFGSTSSPMNAQNANMYSFKHILDPYVNCKEIKVAIDSYKNAKKQNTVEPF